jgi:hypothetical protein
VRRDHAALVDRMPAGQLHSRVARNMAQHHAAFAKKATGKQCTVVRVLDPVRFTTRTSNESHQRYC